VVAPAEEVVSNVADIQARRVDRRRKTKTGRHRRKNDRQPETFTNHAMFGLDRALLKPRLPRRSLLMFVRSVLILVAGFSCLAPAAGADWTRFRGPNGSGVSPDTVPTTWSESQNVKWKKDLPGPGLSSPIIIGDRVVVTCWTGYAIGNDQGSLEDLKRNVVCLDRNTGDVLWNKVEDAVLPEDSYDGMFAENGYASHTPVTDGDRVYVFYGKTGVLAYDLRDGTRLWQKSVGSNREQKG
jgi:hypothetical protein